MIKHNYKEDSGLPDESGPSTDETLESLPVNLPTLGGSIEEVPEIEIRPSIADAINDWISRSDVMEQTPKIYVYRMKGSTSTELCNRFDGEIPDEHIIGLSYGAGKYLCVAQIPQPGKGKPLSKSWRFTVAEHYNELRQRQAASGLLPIPYPVGNSTGFQRERGPGPLQSVAVQTPVSPMEGIKEIAALLKDLLPLVQGPKTDNAAMSNMLSQSMMMQFQMMQRVMQKNLMDTSAFMTRIMQGKYEEIGNGEGESMDGKEEAENPESFIEGLLKKYGPILQAFLPALFDKGPQGTLAAQAAKQMPQVQKIISNTEELRAVVEYLDRTKGKGETDRVLKRLNVKRPIPKIAPSGAVQGPGENIPAKPQFQSAPA